MFPNARLDFIEAGRKSRFHFLILSQAFDDLEYGIDLRYICFGPPLGGIGRIGPNPQVYHHGERQKCIRESEPIFACLALYATHNGLFLRWVIEVEMISLNSLP